MDLNQYRDEAGRFLEAIHAADEPVEQMIAMLEHEMDILKEKESVKDDAAVKHQVYDLLFLLFEIAARRGCDLDAEWAAGKRRKQEKYL